jgi:hypothetical protein
LEVLDLSSIPLSPEDLKIFSESEIKLEELYVQGKEEREGAAGD